MTSSHDLVEYIFLKYISGLDFISLVLEDVKSEEDLDYVLYVLVRLAIQSYGYKTDLTYRNLQKSFKSDFIKRGIFRFTADNLFGEKCEFDVDKYVEYVSFLKEKSAPYARISQQREEFGEEGLRRALTLTALEHKWVSLDAAEPAEIPADGEIQPQPTTRVYLVSEAERQQIVSGLSDLKRTAEESDLDQEAKAQAVALIAAAVCIAESPTPNWRMVREILYSIAAISTVLGLAIQIAEAIR